jgi:hypothetical protein
MKVVTFDPNVPVEVAFLEEDYRPDHDCVVYTLTDGRTMTISTSVAASINMMDIAIGETFMVCKYWNGHRKQAPRWSVWLTPESEKARAKQEEPALFRELGQSIAEANSSRPTAAEVAQQKIEAMRAGVSYAQLSTPESLESPRIADPPVNAAQPAQTGTHGPQAIPMPVQKRGSGFQPVPINVAFSELLTSATEAVKAAGQMWAPEQLQKVVVSMMIHAGERGWLAPWERKA